MKTLFRTLPAFFLLAGGSLFASDVCPSTSFTNSDCAFLITIGTNGAASVSTVTGAKAFNGPQTFADGSTDPGSDASLVGVINDYSKPLTGFTLLGSGAGYGIFDFTFNGICVYASSSYCGTAATGYEGPTTTFSNLKSTKLFETTEGTVSFDPTLGHGDWTFFAIGDSPTDISANGGLSVSGLTFASAPEPAEMGLVAFSLIALSLFRRKLMNRR